jgi:hypothetical protein
MFHFPNMGPSSYRSTPGTIKITLPRSLSAAGQTIVQRIRLLGWQPVRYVAHDFNDVPNDITAGAPGGTSHQILDRSADLGRSGQTGRFGKRIECPIVRGRLMDARKSAGDVRTTQCREPVAGERRRRVPAIGVWPILRDQGRRFPPPGCTSTATTSRYSVYQYELNYISDRSPGTEIGAPKCNPLGIKNHRVLNAAIINCGSNPVALRSDARNVPVAGTIAIRSDNPIDITG